MKISLSSDIGKQLGLMTFIGLVSMLLLSYLFYQAFSDTYYQEQRNQSRHLTSVASSIVESFHKKSMQGELTEDEAKQLSLHALRNARYDIDGYFWINHTNGRMVMHPVMPDLDNTDVRPVQDSNGLYLFQKFTETAQQGGGWVDYLWPKPGDRSTHIEKVSYVSLFEPWDWVIGTGLYLDDLDAKKNQIFIQSAELIAAAVLIMTIISVVMAKRSTSTIRNMAIRDPLTQLYTRRYLNESEDSFVREDNRNQFNHLYIVFLDIDFFKQVNDTYGHMVGDQVLSKVGEVLRTHTRAQDLCVRYGGEEFVVMTLANSDEPVLKLTERLRKHTHELTFAEGQQITLSAGIARREVDESFAHVLQRADQNLYEAKQTGRDRIIFNDPPL
ncbi:diguanylate cyclase [Neptuniibacter caesariensis]|uniref:diguanylate cyclase n=1 Tax=Neptuniibacter caesariensis TaxID=207954 RepID=A0A7U8C972_NEPCE|nr:diguanylate cyclase [Neptuniibacter caesariensis]EAR62420.1 methyl-accepting chemotaxis protein-like [Oceanospirillum sp. MED92] [Neptuniibacter caesariensis]